MLTHTQMKNNFFGIFFAIFAAVGTLFCAIGFFSWSADQTIKRNGIKTTGTVVSFSSSSKGGRAPVISFMTQSGESRTYYSSTYSSPPSYDEGENVTLWYLPNDPDEVVLSGLDSWLLPGIFGGIGLIFGAIGYGGFIWRWRRKRLNDWLRLHGQIIMADVVDVRYNTSLSVGGKHPWMIIAQYFEPQSQKVYSYESDNIWFNPAPFMSPGQKVTVRVSPKDYGVYEVDTSFLPKQGN